MMLDVLFSFDPSLLAAFVIAGLMLNLTPGADFVFVTASSLAGGGRVGRAAAVGINLGIVVHVVMAAAGVSAVLMAHPAAYDVIRYVGAAYLLYLAWAAWRAPDGLPDMQSAISTGAAIRRGFLTNFLNPKTALFIFAFIPQFTDPAIGPIWMQILLLGAIFTLNGFLFVLTLATLTGAFADALRKRVRLLNKLSAILFGGLAARLIMD